MSRHYELYYHKLALKYEGPEGILLINRGSCATVPGLPWLKKYLYVMSSDADEQHTSCMVVHFKVYSSVQRFASKFGGG